MFSYLYYLTFGRGADPEGAGAAGTCEATDCQAPYCEATYCASTCESICESICESTCESTCDSTCESNCCSCTMEDDLQNRWGVHLVDLPTRIPRCTPTQLKEYIKLTVPGFMLFGVSPNGSDANRMAIERATEDDSSRLLVACGSYAGGVPPVLKLTSSTMTASSRLALIGHPDEVLYENSRKQTVALPYHIPDSAEITTFEIKQIEKECLKALHKKIVLAQFLGRPYKAFLLEFCLGGCGAQLSTSFLKSLGVLLSHFNIAVIADECLTMARCGPTMAMTSSLPDEMKNCVKFITTGKITKCGLILGRCSGKPVEVMRGFRGTSTPLDTDTAYAAWKILEERIHSGAIEKTRERVIRLLKVEKEEHWGMGCLIFSSKSRDGIIRGIKNRLLPMLEPGRKPKIGSTTKSHWTRSTVTTKLFQLEKAWIREMEMQNQCDSPFMSALYIYLEQLQKPYGTFTDDNVLNFLLKTGRLDFFLDAERWNIAAGQSTKISKARGHTCVKKATRVASENCSSMKVSGIGPELVLSGGEAVPGLRKKRTGRKRIATVHYNKFALGFNLIP